VVHNDGTTSSPGEIMSQGPRDSRPSPRPTIVGGRPPDDGAELPPVPTGIQRLLRLASVDADFRRELVARPSALAVTAGVDLTASERAVLEAIDPGQLDDMARNMPPPPPQRRDFLRQTAATAVVLLGGAALSGTVQACCPGEDSPTRVLRREMQEDGGASPEEPPERPENRLMDGEGGADPNEPPEPTPPEEPVTEDIDNTDELRENLEEALEEALDRPDHPELLSTGGAAPDLPPPKEDEG
jgi:hypothetical protein